MRQLIGDEFSVELELASPCIYSAHKKLSKMSDNPVFRKMLAMRKLEVASDCSIRPQGHEFRLSFWTEKDLVHLPELVKLLRTCEYYSNNSCGLHVHVDITAMNTIEGFAIWNYSDLIGKKWNEIQACSKEFRPFKRRRSYCNSGEVCGGKYSAVNYCTGRDTVEVRVFNSVLDTRYIRRAVEFARNTVNSMLEQIVVEKNISTPHTVG